MTSPSNRLDESPGIIASSRYDDVFNTTITPVSRPQHRKSSLPIAVYPATVVSEAAATARFMHGATRAGGRKVLFLPRRRIKPAAKRKLTDLACLVVLLLAWGGSGVIAAIAFLKGDPLLLLNNYDYMKKPCVYPRGLLLVDPRNESVRFGTGVCREACPVAGETVCDYNGTNCWTPSVDYEVFMFTKCVPTTMTKSICARSPYLAATKGEFPNPRLANYTPQELAERPDEEDAFVISLDIPGDDPRCGECLDVGDDDESSLSWPPPDPSNCPGTGAKMTDTLTVTTRERPPPLSGLFLDASALSGVLYRWLNDVSNSLLVIFVGGGPVALGAGFIWVAVFACVSRVAIWGTLIGSILGLAFLAYQFLLKGGAFGASREVIRDDILASTGVDSRDAVDLDIFSSQSTEAQNEAYVVAGWLSLVLCLILCVLGVTFRAALSRAGRIMSSASQAIFATPALLSLPFCSFALVSLLCLWFGAVFLYLVSITRAGELSRAFSPPAEEGEETAPATIHIYDYLLLGTLVLLHCFMWFWTLCFVGSVFFTTTAGAVAGWHWSERDGSRGRVWGSLYRVIRFHLGSAAAGSFLVSVMYLVRLALWISRRLAGGGGAHTNSTAASARRAGIGGGGEGSCLTCKSAEGCCCMCTSLGSPVTALCAALRFATKSGLVVTAVRGEGFCHSTKTAFVLMANNVLETGATALASSLVLLLGRLSVTAASCLSTWGMLAHQKDQSGILLPILTAGVLGFFVGGAFIDLYSAAVDTLVIVRCDDVMAKEYDGHHHHRSEDERGGDAEVEEDQRHQLDRSYTEMGGDDVVEGGDEEAEEEDETRRGRRNSRNPTPSGGGESERYWMDVV